ncbi:TIGR00645 family protein [Nonomuraea sp. NPDC003804]|uniref:TIGR00645 family protein n=1 Tax=Nonomuraea sp. NPDC003804 TaxID=3154547 RepID=UPI0033A65FEB
MTSISGEPARRRRGLGHLMFASRWLQAPLYLGLIVAQGLYVWQFMVELWHLGDTIITGHVSQATVDAFGGVDSLPGPEVIVMLAVLGLIDVVMISNLLIMVIVGGYETFVSRIDLTDHPDEPEWLSHVNANVLKVKLGTAIIGISSVHLLQTFIRAKDTPSATMMWQTLMHLAFVASAIGLAYIDRLLAASPAERTKAPAAH